MYNKTKVKRGDIINCHIQVPRFILKNFEGEKNSFFYYNVEKGFIGNNGHSKTLYTKEDYYSQRIERYLSRHYEQPFSEIVNFIKDGVSDGIDHKEINSDIESICIGFIKMLVARDEYIYHKAKERMIHTQFAKRNLKSTQFQHDTVVALSLNNLNNFPYIDSRFVTFSINQTTTPFVLPTLDVIEYSFGPYNCVSVAITPELLVTLIDKKHLNDFVFDDGCIRFIPLIDTHDIMVFNETAFNNQKKRGYGYVVSSDLAVLEELKKGEVLQ